MFSVRNISQSLKQCAQNLESPQSLEMKASCYTSCYKKPCFNELDEACFL